MSMFHSFEYPDDGRSPVRRTEIYAADIDDAARLAVDRVADGYFVGGVVQDDLVTPDTDALVARSDANALDALTRALDGNHSPAARQARAYGDTSGAALGR